MKTLSKLIGLISTLLVIALVVCAVFIPKTQQAMADWATKYSPKYNATVDENLSLKKDLSVINTELANKESTLADVAEQLKARNETIEKNKETISQLQAQIEALEKENKSVLELQNEIIDLGNQNAELKRDVESLTAQLNSLQSKLDELNNLISNSDQLTLIHSGQYLSTSDTIDSKSIPFSDTAMDSEMYYDNLIALTGQSSKVYKYRAKGPYRDLVLSSNSPLNANNIYNLYNVYVYKSIVNNNETTVAIAVETAHIDSGYTIKLMYNGVDVSENAPDRSDHYYWLTATAIDTVNHTATITAYDSEYDGDLLTASGVYKSTDTDMYIDFDNSTLVKDNIAYPFELTYVSSARTFTIKNNDINVTAQIKSSTSFTLNGSTFEKSSETLKQPATITINVDSATRYPSTTDFSGLITVTEGVEYSYWFETSTGEKLEQLPTDVGFYSLKLVVRTIETDTYLATQVSVSISISVEAETVDNGITLAQIKLELCSTGDDCWSFSNNTNGESIVDLITPDYQEYELNFVSFDLNKKTITLQDTKTGQLYVLADCTWTLADGIYTINSATYNGIELVR